MSKKQAKKNAYDRQDGKCAGCGEALPKEMKSFDPHRKIPRTEGGTYTSENTLAFCTTCHLIDHGNYVERTEVLNELKSTVDERKQVMNLKQKISNQVDAYEKRKTDVMNEDTLAFLQEQSIPVNKRMSEVDKRLEKALNEYRKHDALVDAALKVRGIGPVAVAFCTVYIRLEEARHASSLWKYVGLHTSKKERYVKGEKGGGNKILRTVLWTISDSQMKGRNETTTKTGKISLPSPYGHFYDEIKTRLENSDKVVPCFINKKIGYLDLPWSDPRQKNHRHHAALRKITKMFLADYWLVGRTLKGLPTDLPYAEGMLGKSHRTIHPRERGWVYDENTPLQPISAEEMQKVAKSAPPKALKTVTKKPSTAKKQSRVKAK